ncbi:hypothetical protein MKX03_033780 [Papaver bracteatum]|nr:hypothetical protein MKX03_033780 [Papaver bracteatum]
MDVEEKKFGLIFKMMKDKKDIRPLLVKLGVALALSFAGFVYSQFKIRRLNQSITPPPSSSASSSSGMVGKINVGGKVGELRSLPATPSSGDVSVAHEMEDASHQKVITTENTTTVGISPKSTNSKHSGEEEGYLLPEFNEIVHKDFEVPRNNSNGVSPRKEVDSPTYKRLAERETDQELINLRNMVRVLRERERNLEIQLLEYYGLKEQETAVMELQNRLKINTMEAKLFTLKIESLQGDNQRLEAQVADYSRVLAELEAARAKIKMLKRKIRSDGEHNKEELCSLKQKVANLQDQEYRAVWNDPELQKKLQRLKELEDEAPELRRANLRLQRENAELERRLESTQILAESVLEVPETEELKETNQRLREQNDGLAKEIERLQANRCADVEELVYLRWLNACLRYELRNYQVTPGKTVARDLSKTLSPRSEAKAKQLILEYANSEGLGDKSIGLMDFDFEYWSSSQDSNLTESCDFDDSSVDLSATKSHTSSKSKFISKLKKLVHGKHRHGQHRDSSAERNSTSYTASARRESVSASSYDEMVGTYSSSTSSHSATNVDAKTDESGTKTSPLTQSTMRSSLDMQRLRTLSLDDVRELRRRNSDVGPSYTSKRMVLRTENSPLQENSLDEEDADGIEKLELIKFAEALKDSSGNSTPRKRAASYSSF